MATRRTTARGSQATPEPRPLIETDPPRAIRLLESHKEKIEKLDPTDRASVEDAQNYVLADVGRVFGDGSAEWSQIGQNQLIKDPEYLVGDGYDNDCDEASWHLPNKAKRVKAGIDEMLPRICRLIDRARELAALHAPQGADPMNPFNALPHDDFVLIKANGEQHRGRGLWAERCVTVHDARFPVATGDTIQRTFPNGTIERHAVVNVRFEKGMRPIPDAYHIDLSNDGARPASRATPIVNHNTTYNIHGVAGAVGPGATASGNTIIGQATQWNGVDRDRLADELGKLRGALVAEAGEDDDAAAELGPVGEASKALKAGDQAGFFGSFKKFGSKAWAMAQRLGLAYLEHVGREQLGLPPPGSS